MENLIYKICALNDTDKDQRFVDISILSRVPRVEDRINYAPLLRTASFTRD